MTKCNWQGYGFGAPYEDAGCCDGIIYDLDSCEEPGGDLYHTYDEPCPQCQGTGKVGPEAQELGPMALIRQRARSEFDEWLEAIEDEDVRSEITTRIDYLFKLVHTLESPAKVVDNETH